MVSGSVAANDMTVSVSGAAVQTLGLFYYGDAQVQLPFGDGFRCVGGTTTRLVPALSADASGAVQRVLDFTQPPLGSGPTAVRFYQLLL